MSNPSQVSSSTKPQEKEQQAQGVLEYTAEEIEALDKIGEEIEKIQEEIEQIIPSKKNEERQQENRPINTKEQQQKALIQAAIKGDTKLIQDILKNQNIDDIINYQQSNGKTALMLAIEEGCSEIVKMLLDYPGIIPNLCDEDGKTALSFAVEKGDLEIIKTILDHPKTNPNLVDNDGETALTRAVKTYNCNPEIVEMLLKKGANPNQFGQDGKTIFMWLIGESFKKSSTYSNSQKIIKMLFESGVDLNLTDRSGYTTLMHAVFRGNDEALKMILASPKFTSINLQALNKTALMWAAEMGNHEAVKILLSKGADVNPYDKNDDAGYTAFMIAAEKGYYDIVKTLKSKITQKRELAQTLKWAIEDFVDKKQSELLNILFERESDFSDKNLLLEAINTLFKNIDTSLVAKCAPDMLTLAIKYNRPEIVQILLNYPKYNIAEKERNPLIGFAAKCAEQGNDSLKKTLIEKGIISKDKGVEKKPEKSQQNVMGISDATRQRLKPNDDTLDLIEKIEASNPHLKSYNEKAFMWAVENGNEFTAREFLDKGVSPNLTNAKGKVALVIAAEKGYVAIVKILLTNSSFDINNKNDSDAFMLAVEKSHVEVIKAFLEKMNPDVTNKYILNAAMLAAANNDYKALEGLLNTSVLADNKCWDKFDPGRYSGGVKLLLAYGLSKGALANVGINKLFDSYRPQIQSSNRSKFSTLGWWWSKFMGIFYGGIDRYMMKCFIDASRKNDVRSMQFCAETLGFNNINVNELKQKTSTSTKTVYPTNLESSSQQQVVTKLKGSYSKPVIDEKSININSGVSKDKLVSYEQEESVSSSFKP